LNIIHADAAHSDRSSSGQPALPAQAIAVLAAAAFGAVAALVPGSACRAADEGAGAQVKPVLAEHLPNVPGKSVTAVLVSYPPGAKSGKHHHAGSVFVYVLSGAIRSETSATGPARVYRAGESFFEPPGSEHLVSENASTTEPASLLAVFVADEGAQLTIFDK
jgi:quercetin dioxygenase-like cupin family protein